MSVGTIGLRRNLEPPKFTGVTGLSCDVSVEIMVSTSSWDWVLNGGDEIISTSKISCCCSKAFLSTARRDGESEFSHEDNMAIPVGWLLEGNGGLICRCCITCPFFRIRSSSSMATIASYLRGQFALFHQSKEEIYHFILMVIINITIWVLKRRRCDTYCHGHFHLSCSQLFIVAANYAFLL